MGRGVFEVGRYGEGNGDAARVGLWLCVGCGLWLWQRACAAGSVVVGDVERESSAAVIFFAQKILPIWELVSKP